MRRAQRKCRIARHTCLVDTSEKVYGWEIVAKNPDNSPQANAIMQTRPYKPTNKREIASPFQSIRNLPFRPGIGPIVSGALGSLASLGMVGGSYGFSYMPSYSTAATMIISTR